MQVRHDAAWSAFTEAMDEFAEAVRLKQIREQVIIEGRTELRLFERGPNGGRPHPRLRMAFAEVDDPLVPSLPTIEAWPDVVDFRAWLVAALQDPQLRAGLDQAPAEDPHYWRNTLRTGRLTALLDHARAAIDQVQAWSAAERDAARYVIAELGALAYAGDIAFDDENMGTYFSYLRDQPFVHVLETLRASLPDPDSEAFALLPLEEQRSVERQREQLTNHLDYLMRYKYAYDGVVETDIERSVGGFLIDRETRQLVSEDPATRDSLQPRHQLLRIDPASQHPQAGAYIVRTPGGFALRDGTAVEIRASELLSTPIAPEQLTFERAPRDIGLRADIRFDWNRDGWADAQPIDWISWAGHCDIQAVLETIGLALLDQAPVEEYRSDTGEVTELSRDLLLELLASVCEFGSAYTGLDGVGRIIRGIHQFGGARNDSLPDRLQFRGPGQGQYFRWPLGRRQEQFRVVRVREGGSELDLTTAFARCIPDYGAVDFAANPRYLGTVEGDYNLINATGTELSFSARVSNVDASGGFVHQTIKIDLDLRPGATGKTYLGTQIHNPAAREIYRVYLDHDQPAIIAELWRGERSGGGFTEIHDNQYDIVIPLASPLQTTLSREMRRDDPAMFRALVELALHRGQNIAADTDARAPVWNGVVTRMKVERVEVNQAARVERWRMDFNARFGHAVLDYMVRRAEDGTPLAYCPTGTDANQPTPDFLYQDLPDIASKGVEAGTWVVNEAMRERGVVHLRRAPNVQGGWYVEDDHIKNGFELLYAALAGYRFTVVHQNKRYVFGDRAAWEAARQRLDLLRGALVFE